MASCSINAGIRLSNVHVFCGVITAASEPGHSQFVQAIQSLHSLQSTVFALNKCVKPTNRGVVKHHFFPPTAIVWTVILFLICSSSNLITCRRDTSMLVIPTTDQLLLHGLNFMVSLPLISSSAAPRFTKIPVDQIGVSGGVVSFMCQATGDPKPRVTWNKKGKKVNSQRIEVRPEYHTWHCNSSMPRQRCTGDRCVCLWCECVGVLGSMEHRLQMQSSDYAQCALIITS